MTDSEHAIDLSTLSPARAITYETLAEIEPATSQEVADASVLKVETVRDTLKHLQERDLVTKRTDTRDARRYVYELR